jgi:hypothetical protein
MKALALFVGASSLLAAGGAAAFAWNRRRRPTAGSVQPPMPDALRKPEGEDDQQMPQYYGGEQLGRTTGDQHYATAASGKS